MRLDITVRFVLGAILLRSCLYFFSLRQQLKVYVQPPDLLASTVVTAISEDINNEVIEQEYKSGYANINYARSNVTNRIDLSINNVHEPYLNQWQRRFASSKSRNKKGGYLFFKHIRKAGGTSLRGYFRDVFGHHNITRELNDWKAIKDGRQTEQYQVHYIEHEFQTMDWQCPAIDPRWRESIRIIVLRNPIERHLSEYFFSGSGFKLHPISAEQIATNETYAKEVASFLSDQVPNWMKRIGTRKRTRKNKDKKRNNNTNTYLEGEFNMIFGPHYTNNFQLRALSGCSSGECLQEKNVTTEQRNHIQSAHPYQYSYSEPVPRCTNYYRKPAPETALYELCAKPNNVRDFCSIGCDGPCFYPSVAWGELSRKDVARAIHVLKAFDAVLLMEKLGDKDQSDFLADVLGHNRDADFALINRGRMSNALVEKKSKREKLQYWQDLLSSLGLDHINDMLRKENELEMEFFNHASKLNENMINKWKQESV
eukprot:CAMPEP_0183714786 /NCGR_PEP_ID=MMETSP0737-20130205/9224_1 /TAXON_ID=385413 /ORGANISM="Thalassiosira miniscula, Strain CCMP1093" /LENGTH=483 /DNA_ID=CAMNT_0025943789 /DNA_START=175 /DNA_END=1626 /DNA_ORIENTATION=+